MHGLRDIFKKKYKSSWKDETKKKLPCLPLFNMVSIDRMLLSFDVSGKNLRHFLVEGDTKPFASVKDRNSSRN